jgi:hypothetical protein|tara:strand:- start:1879 stop:2070 length:192 start_codon:yes stop_codon:yes gene_type:complete
MRGGRQVLLTFFWRFGSFCARKHILALIHLQFWPDNYGENGAEFPPYGAGTLLDIADYIVVND